MMRTPLTKSGKGRGADQGKVELTASPLNPFNLDQVVQEMIEAGRDVEQARTRPRRWQRRDRPDVRGGGGGHKKKEEDDEPANSDIDDWLELGSCKSKAGGGKSKAGTPVGRVS